MNENRKLWLLILACAAAIALLAGLGYALFEKQNAFNRSYDRMVELTDGLNSVFDEVQPLTRTRGGISFGSTGETPPETETETQALPSRPSDRIIFVGDSRTVGMQRAVPSLIDPCIYIAASGEGLLWFEASGIHRLERTLRRYPDSPVVFNLGVNDTESIDRYIAVYRGLIAAYPETAFWFLSVNPVTEDSLLVPDEDVQAFNLRLMEAFPERYIDSYAWLKDEGFESVDGVHYSEDTYRAIYRFTVDAVLPDAG